MSEEDKVKIEAIVSLAVDSSLFGFLCVLDGVRTIEDQGSKGRLELNFVKDGQAFLLNDPDNEYLHDLYVKSF